MTKFGRENKWFWCKNRCRRIGLLAPNRIQLLERNTVSTRCKTMKTITGIPGKKNNENKVIDVDVNPCDYIHEKEKVKEKKKREKS